MALNIDYDSYEEVHMRLQGTVVRYDGEPVYVSNVTQGDDGVPRIHIMNLPVILNGREEVNEDNKVTRKVVNSRHFDFEPFLLGYANLKYGACFLSRAPVRKYKQGLSSGNLTDAQGRLSFKAALADPGFKDALKNEYPPRSVATEMAKDKSITVAFCREFAVEYNSLGYFLLHYRGAPCAFSEDGYVFKLPEQFKYLSEVLQENKVAFR